MWYGPIGLKFWLLKARAQDLNFGLEPTPIASLLVE